MYGHPFSPAEWNFHRGTERGASRRRTTLPLYLGTVHDTVRRTCRKRTTRSTSTWWGLPQGPPRAALGNRPTRMRRGSQRWPAVEQAVPSAFAAAPAVAVAVAATAGGGLVQRALRAASAQRSTTKSSRPGRSTEWPAADAAVAAVAPAGAAALPSQPRPMAKRTEYLKLEKRKYFVYSAAYFHNEIEINLGAPAASGRWQQSVSIRCRVRRLCRCSCCHQRLLQRC